jgi:hypothetical protein
MDIGRRDFFGLTDSDMERFDEMCQPKKTKRKKRKPKPDPFDL